MAVYSVGMVPSRQVLGERHNGKVREDGVTVSKAPSSMKDMLEEDSRNSLV